MSKAKQDEKRPDNVQGDPGVGGLMADPLAPAAKHDQPDPAAGPPSSDPEKPRHHGDWLPTQKDAQQRATRRPHPLMTRRRSSSGMPLALFREGDGMSLEDLRMLEQIAARR